MTEYGSKNPNLLFTQLAIIPMTEPVIYKLIHPETKSFIPTLEWSYILSEESLLNRFGLLDEEPDGRLLQDRFYRGGDGLVELSKENRYLYNQKMTLIRNIVDVTFSLLANNPYHQFDESAELVISNFVALIDRQIVREEKIDRPWLDWGKYLHRFFPQFLSNKGNAFYST